MLQVSDTRWFMRVEWGAHNIRAETIANVVHA